MAPGLRRQAVPCPVVSGIVALVSSHLEVLKAQGQERGCAKTAWQRPDSTFLLDFLCEVCNDKASALKGRSFRALRAMEQSAARSIQRRWRTRKVEPAELVSEDGVQEDLRSEFVGLPEAEPRVQILILDSEECIPALRLDLSELEEQSPPPPALQESPKQSPKAQPAAPAKPLQPAQSSQPAQLAQPAQRVQPVLQDLSSPGEARPVKERPKAQQLVLEAAPAEAEAVEEVGWAEAPPARSASPSSPQAPAEDLEAKVKSQQEELQELWLQLQQGQRMWRQTQEGDVPKAPPVLRSYPAPKALPPAARPVVPAELKPAELVRIDAPQGLPTPDASPRGAEKSKIEYRRKWNPRLAAQQRKEREKLHPSISRPAVLEALPKDAKERQISEVKHCSHDDPMAAECGSSGAAGFSLSTPTDRGPELLGERERRREASPWRREGPSPRSRQKLAEVPLDTNCEDLEFNHLQKMISDSINNSEAEEEHGARSAGLSLGAPEPNRRMADIRAAAERRLQGGARREAPQEILQEEMPVFRDAEKPRQTDIRAIAERRAGGMRLGRTPGSPRATTPRGSATRTPTPRGGFYKPNHVYSSRAEGR